MISHCIPPVDSRSVKTTMGAPARDSFTGKPSDLYGIALAVDIAALPGATLTAGTKRYQPHLGTLMIACVQIAGRLEVRRCIVEQAGFCLLKVRQHTADMSDVFGGV